MYTNSIIGMQMKGIAENKYESKHRMNKYMQGKRITTHKIWTQNGEQKKSPN